MNYNGDVLIVGTYSQPEVTVHITESLTTARRQVRRSILGRLVALAALGLVAMLLVNSVVLRIVGRPIRMLVETVDRIRNGDYLEPNGSFSTREFAKLAAAVSLMSKTLQDDKNQRRSQMEKAREVQQHLLPRDVDVPGLAMGTWFEPAHRVSGDYYDVFPLSDGSWLIVLADVSGHGFPSALEAAILKVLLVHAAEQTHDPAEILQLVNNRFVDAVPESHFASAFLLRWRPEESRLDYANAGHIPGLFRASDQRVIQLDASGFPIGIEKGAVWETQSISVRGDECFLIVSDGVIECRSKDGSLFGNQRLSEFFKIVSSERPEQTVRQLKIRVEEFTDNQSPLDDTTALAIQFSHDKSASQVATALRVRESSKADQGAIGGPFRPIR